MLHIAPCNTASNIIKVLLQDINEFAVASLQVQVEWAPPPPILALCRMIIVYLYDSCWLQRLSAQLMSSYPCVYTCCYAAVCSTAQQRSSSSSETELSSYVHVWDYEMCSLIGTCVLPQSHAATVSCRCIVTVHILIYAAVHCGTVEPLLNQITLLVASYIYTVLC
jgi:hypothetical protein